MNDTVDLLQIKIENAKRELPEETQNAIAAVDWKMAILGMRGKKGFTFEQLGDLELETELLLSGLIPPADYPKELERRMGISKSAANDLVNEMNEQVFKKIREELIKNTERKKIFAGKITAIKEAKPAHPNESLELYRKEPLPEPEKLEITTTEKPKQEIHPILTQKLSNIFKTPTINTDHSLNNLSKTNPPVSPKIDPYREIPE